MLLASTSARSQRNMRESRPSSEWIRRLRNILCPMFSPRSSVVAPTSKRTLRPKAKDPNAFPPETIEPHTLQTGLKRWALHHGRADTLKHMDTVWFGQPRG